MFVRPQRRRSGVGIEAGVRVEAWVSFDARNKGVFDRGDVGGREGGAADEEGGVGTVLV